MELNRLVQNEWGGRLRTCVAVGHAASPAEAEAMRAEVEDEVAVVREHPDAHADQVT